MYVYVYFRTFFNRFFSILCALGMPQANNSATFPKKSVAMPQCHGLVRTLDHCNTQEKLKAKVMQNCSWQSRCTIFETEKMVNKRQNVSTIYNEAPFNTDTKGAVESVCINWVSVFSRLNLEKM